MGKPENVVRKSNGSPHSVWEASHFQSVQLNWRYFVVGRSPTTSNSIVLCLCTKFPVGGLRKWEAPLDYLVERLGKSWSA